LFVAEPVFACERLTYGYPGAGRPALRDVSLELRPGSFTVIAGVSGCGKSTLLRAACGLVPHFHGGDVEGSLVVGGLDVRDHGPGELASVCGTVLQEPETQVVMGGVRAEVALALEHRGESASAVARAVEEVALMLGIERLLDRRVETLSGGELQRVALAAALAGNPSLLVLDEPTSQLDPVAGDELVWLLRRLNEEWGVAVLVAEHRLERCLPAADRVVVLEDGAVACDAPPAEFLAWAASARPVLATPAAQLFARAGLKPLPVSVREGREQLRGAGLFPTVLDEGRIATPKQDSRAKPALQTKGVWHEIKDGPAILRGIDLTVRPGERVALMGRNGAGKSTLLRHLKGLVEPTRGRIKRGGEIALLLQTPGDYLVHERVEQEASPEQIARAGLTGKEQTNPRDLSSGERQRLALEIVLRSDAVPAVVCLDEPTRGMSGDHKAQLVERLRRVDAAVVVATHDTELAAQFADRVVLMGEGVIIADGPTHEVLAGGRHFTTDVARILGGAALTADQGAELINRELVVT
jgi:energy-coupling factor transport system ATP-binding protein